MSDIAIKVENLSKRYRIGLKDEMPDTFVGEIKSWLKAPFTSFKQLQKLTKFEETDRQVYPACPVAPVDGTGVKNRWNFSWFDLLNHLMTLNRILKYIHSTGANLTEVSNIPTMSIFKIQELTPMPCTFIIEHTFEYIITES